MSGNFWDHYGSKGGYLDQQNTDESIYQAWERAGLGTYPGLLELVPAVAAENPEIWKIAYLQAINHRYNRQTGTLCLMVPNSGLQVFLEGRGLRELSDEIAERKVKTVRMFDPDIHQPIGNDAPIVTSITVEKG